MLLTAVVTRVATKKPNILIIWGDDIGYWNLSAYNQGMMGTRRRTLTASQRKARCSPTGMVSKAAPPGARASSLANQVSAPACLRLDCPALRKVCRRGDVTIAELLKAQGYVTGQFGKNHLGDRDEHLPTAHGFGEFYGSLYHLNAEQEPEHPDYFKDPEMRKKYATRGVLHTWANPDGSQKIELTGPLNIERMRTVDDEFTKEALRFMTDANKENKPFFVWWNATRMHIWTHLSPQWEGKTGLGIYPDGMMEHDYDVGLLLDKLKELGLEDNTIVMYSTDNGAEKFSWPDGGISPFRNEKASNWEGAYRVPCAIRWPGVIKPGTVLNDIFSHEDMLPTLLAAAGVPDVKEQLLKGMKVGNKTFKVHLDGYNLTDTLAGKSPARARNSSTSTTTGHSLRSATTNTKSSSPNSARMAWMSGRILSCHYVSRSFSICAPIRSRPPTTRALIMAGGGSITPLFSCRRSNTSDNSSPHSRNSRRARSPAAFRSTTRCKVCRTRRRRPAINLNSSSRRPARKASTGAPFRSDLYDQGPIRRGHETCESVEPTVIGSQEPPRCNFNPSKTKA